MKKVLISLLLVTDDSELFECIKKLDELGYINDDQFCKWYSYRKIRYIQQRIDHKPVSKLRLTSELNSKVKYLFF